MHDEEDDQMEPNMKFIEPWDNFCSFSKAAGFIEDWIRTKKNNATDFTTDFPALLERGKSVRTILIHLRESGAIKSTNKQTNKDGALINPEIKNVQQLIFSKELYETEDDYVFYFTINLVEHCCLRPEVPLLVIRIAWNFIKQAIENNRLKLTENHKQFAISKIEKMRAEIVFEFVHNLGINNKIDPDYFEKLIENHIENG